MLEGAEGLLVMSTEEADCHFQRPWPNTPVPLSSRGELVIRKVRVLRGTPVPSDIHSACLCLPLL